MSNSIQNIQDEIIAEFSRLDSWEKKYSHLIQLGKKLAPMDESYKTEDLKVKGCQSQVWLKAGLNTKGNVHLQADSDALIVKGLVALLLRVYDDQSAKEILNTELFFIDKTELAHHLSASRTNGLNSMIKQIKYYAQAFQILASQSVLTSSLKK